MKKGWEIFARAKCPDCGRIFRPKELHHCGGMVYRLAVQLHAWPKGVRPGHQALVDDINKRRKEKR